MNYPKWINNHQLAITLLPKENYVHMNPTQPRKEELILDKHSSTAKQMYWMQKDEDDKQKDRSKDQQEEHSENTDDIHYLYRADIAMVNISTGETKRLIENRKARLAFPSPDGNYILFSVPANPPDITRFDGAMEDLYCINLQQIDAEPILIASGLQTIRNIRHDPAFAPNSKRIAYLKGLELHVYHLFTDERQVISLESLQNIDYRFLLWHPNDRGWVVKSGARLYFVDVEGQIIPLQVPEGKNPRGLIRPSEGGFFYTTDGESCVLWSMDKMIGNSQLYRMPLNGDAPSLLYEDEDSLQAASFHRTYAWFSDVSADGSKIIVAAENTFQPMELYLLNDDFKPKQKITSLNHSFQNASKGRIMHTTWEDSSGKKRNGMLLLPESHHGQNIPLIINVYPNIPFSAFQNTWDKDTADAIVPPQWLADSGYAVFIPDLFVDTKQFMKDIARELELALQSIRSIDRIDIDRMAVMGHSFGGYTVNCLITQTNRFKAAISNGAYSDLISAYSSYDSNNGRINGFGCQWLETGQMNQGGAPWEVPDNYVANSPLFNLHQVETPLLLIGGGMDSHYMPQGMLVGLERLKKKVRCYVYEGEGHVPAEWSLANKKDVAEKVGAWLEDHLS